MQFTIETQTNNFINFLDLNLIIHNEQIIIDWYNKPKFSGHYLNFYLAHYRLQKIGTIIGMIDKVLLLSHTTFQEK